MAAPVWVLSVDLQTKTATFQSGLAEAAKTARSSFKDIEGGAQTMGASVGSSTYSARQGVMLLANEFGEHLPRGLVTFISQLGPVAGAMEAAFPFIAIAAGAVILLTQLQKMKAAGIELTEEQTRFGTTVQTVFNGLNDKLLQAQIRSDELKNDHLGALKKQLELIDAQSMDELVAKFGEIAKASDAVFKDLQSHWYTFGIGSAGAKHALDDFRVKYDALLASGEKGQATDLLKGTLGSAQKVLDAMTVAKSPAQMQDSTQASADREGERIRANNTLKAAGVGITEKEVQAQQNFVELLTKQLTIEGKVAAIKQQDGDNAKTSTNKEGSAMAATEAKAAADARARIGELSLQADRAVANAEADILRASVEQRTDIEVAFANREMTLRLQANGEQMAALDKMANDYLAKLKELQDKSVELVAQHETEVTQLRAKGSVEANNRDLQTLEQGIRESIEATRQGSAERLAAIDAGIKLEAAKHMQDLASYRDLLTQRVEVVRQSAEEEAKLSAESSRESADNELKMGELTLAAKKQAQALADSSRRVSIQMQMSEETQAANAEYALKLTALQMEAAALDKGAKDYQNKLQANLNREKQLYQQHENDVAAIKSNAQIATNQKILAAEQQYTSQMAASLTQVIMGQKGFASAMSALGSEVVSSLMQMALKHIEMNMLTKQSDAAMAARKGFNAGLDFPFPANLVMGPMLGAAMYAQVMAFQEGTDMVPGIGKGDTVPAMLEPGEGVVPGGVMDGLRQLVQNGGLRGGHTINARAHFAPTVHALDSDGVDRVLDKHADKFQQHFEGTLRRMGR